MPDPALSDMTMLDYLAARAMANGYAQALFSAENEEEFEQMIVRVARTSYMQGRAMLEVRAQLEVEHGGAGTEPADDGG